MSTETGVIALVLFVTFLEVTLSDFQISFLETNPVGRRLKSSQESNNYTSITCQGASNITYAAENTSCNVPLQQCTEIHDCNNEEELSSKNENIPKDIAPSISSTLFKAIKVILIPSLFLSMCQF